MKTFKKLILFSVAACLFNTTASAAEANLLSKQAVENQLMQSLTIAMQDIALPSTKQDLTKALNKLQRSVNTDLLVRDAKRTLPTNQFKVVIAD